MRSILLFSTLFSSLVSAWDFSEQSVTVGLNFQHGYDDSVVVSEPQMIASGLAIGDVNGDGWDDIFAVTGENVHNVTGVNYNPNKLFIAQGDGSFVESAGFFGLNTSDIQSSAPLIIDINGDSYRDLIFGSVGIVPVYSHYINLMNNGFIASISQLTTVNTFSTSAADCDKDGDLDLMVSHWLQDTTHLFWQNDGAGNFLDITLPNMSGSSHKSSFTPVFSDINGDNFDDLLLTSDFTDSEYFINDGSGQMIIQSLSAITDENGMGAAVADYDNDGDFDWFVTSIYDPDGIPEGNWGVSGNRLYNNDGTGEFTDVSITAGVNHGYWGWGACFADFNNDMYLDIFHVNGFPSDMLNEPEFVTDLSRLFINNGDGTFTERSAELGIVDTAQGRAITCFDNGRNGSIDILINNFNSSSKYYNNNLDNNNHYVTIKLVQQGGNIDAIGAKISITTGGVTQLRQVMAGGSFASSNPTAQHFGMGTNTMVETMTITWPDDTIEVYNDFFVDHYYVVTKNQPNSIDLIFDNGFE